MVIRMQLKRHFPRRLSSSFFGASAANLSLANMKLTAQDNDDNQSIGSFSEASEASVSHEFDSSKSSNELTPARQPVRDEVKEIEKANKKDTNWIRAWRSLLILTLSATAAAVTFVTFRFLDDEQDGNYKASVSPMLRTVYASLAKTMATFLTHSSFLRSLRNSRKRLAMPLFNSSGTSLKVLKPLLTF